MRALLFVISMIAVAHGFKSLVNRRVAVSGARLYSGVNDVVPSKILCDVVEADDGCNKDGCKVSEAQDFGELLKSRKKAILFGVPGAFTPTCSANHLPGFINNADKFRAKGVEAIYCLSVNDRFVMKAWGAATSGYLQSGIKLVGDGNADYTKAPGLVKDGTGSRMGLRCKRFAAILENGQIKVLNVDEKGLDQTSAEVILSLL